MEIQSLTADYERVEKHRLQNNFSLKTNIFPQIENYFVQNFNK